MPQPNNADPGAVLVAAPNFINDGGESKCKNQ